jgi:hypothetical protein
MMTYYVTKTNPLVYTTQKAERVEEWMVQQMLETLLKREYEVYEPREAKSNLQDVLQTDEVFSGAITPPSKAPTDEQTKPWVEEFLMTEAGRLLQRQAGAPLRKLTANETSLVEEMTLSDYLPLLTIASEWDSEGPELHSQTMGQ